MSAMLLSCIVAVAGLALPKMAHEAIENRITANDPSDCLSRFVDYERNAAKDVFVVNPKFWLKDVDFSCVSPWNSAGGNLRAGTAISRRHVVFAKHFPLWKGVRIVFTDNEGGVCPCWITGTKAIEGTDIMVGALNAELTPNIQPAKILPADYEKYIGIADGMPVITFNQREKAFLTDLNFIPTNECVRTLNSHIPFKPHRARHREKIITGDSGNPAFLLVGKMPVLLYCLLGPGGGSSIFRYRREVQAAMDELCPGYALEAVDFSKMKSSQVLSGESASVNGL